MKKLLLVLLALFVCLGVLIACDEPTPPVVETPGGVETPENGGTSGGNETPGGSEKPDDGGGENKPCVHTFGEWESVTPATCGKAGEEKRSCTACGEKETRPTDALAHDEESHPAQAPTCTEKGHDAYVSCKREGCTYTTYAEKGALGHNPTTAWAYDAENHYHTCTREGCSAREDVAPHTYDGELDADCNECGAIRATHCSHSTTEPIVGYPATCIAVGKTDGVMCTACGETLTLQEEIAALGHDEESHAAQAPTCTEKGHDAYVTCKRDGCTYTTYAEKAALGHDEESYAAQAPTCTEKGHDAYVTCKRDGCTYTTYAEKAALGHTEENHAAQAPTCTAVGWDAYVSCKSCDHTTYVEKPALGHAPASTWSKDASTHYHACTRANCTYRADEAGHTYDGELDADCNICGAVRTTHCSHPTTEPIFGYPATCTATGMTDGAKCLACGETVTAQAEIAALGHDEESHAAQAPTCTEKGHDAYVTCKREGCTYTTYAEKPALGHNITSGWIMREDRHWHPCTNDGCEEKRNEGAHVYTDDFDKNCNTCGYIREVAPCTHPTTEPIVGYPATCTEAGRTDGVTCTVCHATVTAQTVIPALGHDEESHAAQTPTCEEIGWAAYVTCRREECSYTTYLEKPALGHGIDESKGWQYDDEWHYYPCKNPPCEAKLAAERHTPDENALCTVCGHQGVIVEFTYEKVEGGYAITGYFGKDMLMEIPATYNGEPIVAIGKQAFACKTLLPRIVIPSTVKRIEEGAFFETNVSVLEIPASVTYIGDNAFTGCRFLTWMSFEEGSRLKTIGKEAFRGCSELAIALPEGLETIGPMAFYSSGLIDMQIPASVCEIGFSAFQKCYQLRVFNFRLGCRLEKIESETFSECSEMTIIFIGENVKEIGHRAFYGCSKLVAVETADDSCMTLIEMEAFAECYMLERVQFPASLERIESHAFQNCGSLKSIELPQGLLEIGLGAFLGCEGVESITLPFVGDAANNPTDTQLDYIFNLENDPTRFGMAYARIPNGLKTVVFTGSIIPKSAFFAYTQIEYVTIAASVTEIGAWAFDNCTGLKEVIFEQGSSLAYIGNSAFAQCSALTKISFPEGLQEIGTDAFFNMGLTSIHIPASVTAIRDGAFRGCEYLESVTFGKNSCLSTIGADAFASDSLRTIEIPASVTEIGESAFHQFWGAIEKVYIEDIGKYCAIRFGDVWSSPFGEGATLYVDGKAVDRLVIPAWVEYISAYAFGGLKVEEISFEENSILTTIGEGAFNSSSVRTLLLPASVTHIREGAFASCEELTSVTLPAMQPVDIARYAFEGTEEIETISITTVAVESLSAEIARCGLNKLTTVYIIGGDVIGEYLLTDCSAITCVVIDDSIGEIGDRAFVYLSNLQEVIFGEKSQLGFIGNYAFYGCGKLESITLPVGVKTIGESAFEYCTKLKSIEVPIHVASIGYGAFRDCWNLTSITLPFVGDGNKATHFGYIFGATDYNQNKDALLGTRLKSVTVTRADSIGAYAFYGCENLTSILLNYGVKSIEEGAFSGCKGLETFVVPSTVQSIARNAFYECTGLTFVALSKEATSIGASAFQGCKLLNSIQFTGSKADWEAITTGSDWDSNTGAYTVYCSDGNIAKS